MLPPEDLRSGDLAAAVAPPGPDWIAFLRDAWEKGAAILPIDHRLPEPERRDVVRRARPTLILDEGRWNRLPDGLPAEGLALVVQTSGTAGPPKLVELERGAIESAIGSSSGALGATSRDPWVCCLPLAHVGGLLVALRAIVLGAPVVVLGRFDTADVAAAGADFVSLVPTMLRRLLDTGVDPSPFRSILVGGGPLAGGLLRRAAAAGARVVETYGLTETCGGVVYDGRPLPGTEVRIANGEVQLRGPSLMRGYRLDAVRRAAAFTDDGWLRTGDAGELDAGTLRVFGRLDDVINSGGEKIWPHEVEAALSTHPKVADVAVSSRADHTWGQRVVAFVVPTDPADPPALGELRDHASATIARFKAPSEVVFVDAVPRTPSGKFHRSAVTTDR